MSVPVQEVLAPADRQIRAYPNPARSIVTLSFEGMPTGKYQLTILDGIGKAVRTSKILIEGKTAKLNMSAFARGFYTISVSDGIKTSVAKIVLQ